MLDTIVWRPCCYGAMMSWWRICLLPIPLIDGEEKAQTGLPVHCPVLPKLSLLPGHNDNPRLKIKGRWRIKASFYDNVKMVV